MRTTNHEPRTTNHEPRKVILLSGEGGTAFNDKTVEKYSSKLSGLGVDLTTIGNGLQGLGEKEIEQFCKVLEDVKVGQDVTLLVQSHGVMKDGQFGFCLGKNDKPISSKKFFDLINAHIDGKPVDIFTEACHGGGAMDDVNILPKGSTYACLTDRNSVNVGIDYHNMVDELEKFEGDLTSYNLMQHFTGNYLKNRHAPSIGVSGGKVVEMDKYLLGVGGYGSTTKEQAIARSSGITLDQAHKEQSSHPGYEEIFDKVKNGDLVYAKEYGTALSIVLNSEKDNFIAKEQEKQKRDD